jgi:hypothetical protein
VFDEIRVLHGVEVTSSAPSEPAPWTLGHLNAWPIAHQPWAHRHGAPPSQRVSAGDLVARLHGEYGALVVQLNHPRGTEPGRYDGHFFTHQGSAGRAVDPELPLEAAVNEALLAPGADGSRAIDFDAIELMNGSSHEQYLAVRRDFHWLLRQGVRRTATANSDTHGPDELAGLPRNYVRVGSEPGPMGRLSSALREGRSFGTNGPLILRFQVGGGESGGMVRAREGRVVVDYEVTSAPWVPLDEVRVLVNGEVVRALPRRSGRFDISLRRDAFVTLEAGVPERMDPALWRARNPGLYRDALAPGFVPTAFANPVYVDADGDGHWTPPGLRVRRAGVGRPLLVAALGVALLGAALGLRGRAGRRATT